MNTNTLPNPQSLITKSERPSLTLKLSHPQHCIIDDLVIDFNTDQKVLYGTVLSRSEYLNTIKNQYAYIEQLAVHLEKVAFTLNKLEKSSEPGYLDATISPVGTEFGTVISRSLFQETDNFDLKGLYVVTAQRRLKLLRIFAVHK